MRKSRPYGHLSTEKRYVALRRDILAALSKGPLKIGSISMDLGFTFSAITNGVKGTGGPGPTQLGSLFMELENTGVIIKDYAKFYSLTEKGAKEYMDDQHSIDNKMYVEPPMLLKASHRRQTIDEKIIKHFNELCEVLAEKAKDDVGAQIRALEDENASLRMELKKAQTAPVKDSTIVEKLFGFKSTK